MIVLYFFDHRIQTKTGGSSGESHVRHVHSKKEIPKTHLSDSYAFFRLSLKGGKKVLMQRQRMEFERHVSACRQSSGWEKRPPSESFSTI